LKVVIDTNVLISGIFFSGIPSEILKGWRRGDIKFVLSSEIADEYVKVAKILANDFTGVEINSILTLILTNSEIIQAPAMPHQVCEDLDDDKFLACALAGECKVIIDGDKHLLKLSGYKSIDILTPRMFIERYLPNQRTGLKSIGLRFREPVHPRFRIASSFEAIKIINRQISHRKAEF
jgi:uncharacterized protein